MRNSSSGKAVCGQVHVETTGLNKVTRVSGLRDTALLTGPESTRAHGAVSASPGPSFQRASLGPHLFQGPSVDVARADVHRAGQPRCGVPGVPGLWSREEFTAPPREQPRLGFRRLREICNASNLA